MSGAEIADVLVVFGGLGFFTWVWTRWATLMNLDDYANREEMEVSAQRYCEEHGIDWRADW